MRHRERAEEHARGYAEGRRGCPDSKAEDDNDEGGVSGIAPAKPQSALEAMLQVSHLQAASEIVRYCTSTNGKVGLSRDSSSTQQRPAAGHGNGFPVAAATARELVVTVTHAPNQAQCYVALPLGDLAGAEWRLSDQIEGLSTTATAPTFKIADCTWMRRRGRRPSLRSPGGLQEPEAE